MRVHRLYYISLPKNVGCCCCPIGQHPEQVMRGLTILSIGGVDTMASDKRIKIVLACSECKQRNYNTIKNKKNDPDRLEMNKYCRFCKKHTSHKEAK